MISFDLLKEIEDGYKRAKDLLGKGKFKEAKIIFETSKTLETDIVDLLEDMLFYDNGVDELLTARIKNHLETMNHFSEKSETISSYLYAMAK